MIQELDLTGDEDGLLPTEAHISHNHGSPLRGNQINWPLSFKIDPEKKPKWFNYKSYCGPGKKKVILTYSTNKTDSEKVARQFLNEPILGFDMEWQPWENKRFRVQDEVSVIQIASEDKIALFHIALHKGNTANELIAPSLRKILESTEIIKVGVNVLSADFSRLRKHLEMKPKAAFELSHLYHLVKHGGSHLCRLEPEEHAKHLGNLTTKVRAFDVQVEDMLGMKLWKGSERSSDWNAPKRLDEAQQRYAANDAYAGFMLYHCMDAKRLQMDPVPPLPLLCDSADYRTPPTSGPRYIRLRPAKDGQNSITTKEFYPAKEPEKDEPEADKENHQKAGVKQGKRHERKPKEERDPLDPISQELYHQLVQRRLCLATQHSCKIYIVASNATLEDLARTRPTDAEALLHIKNIGKKKQEQYGTDWIEVITQFQAEKSIDSTAVDLPATPIRPERLRRTEDQPPVEDTPSSPPAFGTPLQRTPQLHTGLSFTLASAQLEEDINEKRENDSSDAESDAFYTPPTRPSSRLKRKRSESVPRDRSPSPAPKSRQAFTPRTQRFRSQLLALRNRAATHLKLQDANVLVSESTLDLVVSRPPRTKQELDQIPGITALAEACKQAGMDLLKNITKWAPARY